MSCLKSPKSSEFDFFKQTVVNNPCLYLFQHVLTTVQLKKKDLSLRWDSNPHSLG